MNNEKVKEGRDSSDGQPKIGWGGVIGKTLIAGGTVVALPCMALKFAGFGVGGIVAGSLAAMKQSAIGNVVAGSLFATLQSFGATAVFTKGMAAGGAAAAAGVTTVAIQKTLRHKESTSKNSESTQVENSSNNGWGGVIGKALIVSGTVVALPCMALKFAGFGVWGIVAGSLAAMKQSAIGNVVAGSLFATLQSFGATAVFAKGMAAGGAAAAAGVTTVAIQKNLRHKELTKNTENNKVGKSGSVRCSNVWTTVCAGTSYVPFLSSLWKKDVDKPKHS